MNEALRPKFLDLKEGAIVISLKPFVSSLNARVTERNVSLTYSSTACTITLMNCRSTTSAPSSTSLSTHIIRVAYRGGTMVGLITYTVLTERDMRIFYSGLKILEQDR